MYCLQLAVCQHFLCVCVYGHALRCLFQESYLIHCCHCFAQFEVVDKLEPDDVLKGSKAEQCSFANHLVLQLALLQTTMHQYER